jgi:ABC-type sugar transport system permease subunit
MKRIKETPILLFIPLIFFLFSFVLYPIALSVFYSFHDIEIGAKSIKFVGIKNFLAVLNDPHFYQSLAISFRFILEVAIMTTLLSLGIALILNEIQFFRGIIGTIILIPYAVSEFTTAFSWKWFLSSDWGLLNGILYSLGLIKEYIWFINYDFATECLSIAYSWHIAPLCTFFILAGLQTIPEDLYKQAKIDGSKRIRRFFNITVPFIKYAILITLVISTLFPATTADIVILLTGGGPGISSSTLTYYIYEETFRKYGLGYGAAMSWILIFIVIILTIIYFLALSKKGAKKV